MIELGNNKAVVRSIFPLASKMKICIDCFGFLTRDTSFPYKKVFNGEKRYQDDYQVVNTLRTHNDLYSRKLDYQLPSKYLKENKNPSVTLEFFEGELQGQSLTLTKNLLYQLKTEALENYVPEVKSSFTIGRAGSCRQGWGSRL